MKMLIPLLIVVLCAFPACGAKKTDASPKASSTDGTSAEIGERMSSVGASERTSDDGNRTNSDTIVLAQADSATSTITNDGEEAVAPGDESKPKTGSVFISGQQQTGENQTNKDGSSTFEWSDPEDSKEVESAAESKQITDAEEKASEETQAEIDAIQKKADDDVEAARAEMQKELQALRDQQAEILAQIEASKKEAAEREARDAKSKEELARLKEKAEKEKVASDAARMEAVKTAEKKAKEKVAAEEALERAKMETAQVKADAEKARMQAVAEAKNKAAVEDELLKVKEAQAESERAAKQAKKPAPVPKPVKSKSTKPKGTIVLASLVQGAERDGVYGIEFGSQVDIENLSGAKIEIAAYFFDKAGKPLKDKDRINRSSRGQVYVGQEMVVSMDVFTLNEGLFLPYTQLDLDSQSASDLEVELVLWEYSRGRGNRLAVAERRKFTHTPLSSSERINIKRRADISGEWQQGDVTVSIGQDDETITIVGMKMVPYNILKSEWNYVGGLLRGSVVNKRKLTQMTRVWEFELRVSEDGNKLSGVFRRSDKRGNFAFDSDPFTWTRIE